MDYVQRHRLIALSVLAVAVVVAENVTLSWLTNVCGTGMMDFHVDFLAVDVSSTQTVPSSYESETF